MSPPGAEPPAWLKRFADFVAEWRPVVVSAARQAARHTLEATRTGWQLARRCHRFVSHELEHRLPTEARPFAAGIAGLSLALVATSGVLATASVLASVIGRTGAVVAEAQDAPDAGPFEVALDVGAPVRIDDEPSEPASDSSPQVAASPPARDWWDEEPEPRVDPRVRQMEAAIGLFALLAGAGDAGGGGSYDSSDEDWHRDVAENQRRQMQYEQSRQSSYDSPSMFQSSPVWDGAYAPSPGWNEASPVWQGAYSTSW